MKRRAFVLGSVAVTGGLAIGYTYYRLSPKLPPKLPDTIPLKPGETAITPYVVIDGSGITLIAPRAEMGQGIRTGLAALVAEELDVTLEDVAVVHGPPSELYSNQEMFGEPRFKGRMHRNPTQFTGAQSSTRDAYVKMRKAGAAARLVLVEAAARKLGVEKANLKTGGGGVTAPDGRRLSYVELAPHAAKLDLPEDPPLKTRDEWKILGKSQQRVDMVPKCTGTAVFGVDVSVPDMLHATAIRNPGFDGGLLALDPKRAEAIQGVEKVIPVENGVILVATNTWLAFEAAKLLDCEWDPAPYPPETEGHFDLLVQEFAREPFEVPLDVGDVDSAFEDAEVISGEYRVPYLAHATMEPMNATARFKNGKLTLWAGVQNPTQTVRTCARLAKIDEDDVTLVSTYLGCGFGRRLEQDVIRLAVRAALEMEGRPVKLTLSREEDTRQDAYRPLAVGRFRAGLISGRLDALEFKVSVPSLHNRDRAKRGVRDRQNVRYDKSQTIGLVEQRYLIHNRRVAAYLPPNLLWVGFWRGVAETQNTFFYESAMDEIAHAAGRDPMEMRLSLIDHRPSRAVLEAVADMSDWGTPMPEGHARGLAYAISSGAATAQVIEVRNGPRGIEVKKACVAVDVGVALDPRNIHAQLEGALIFGLTAAVMGEVTVSGGGVTQSNFHDYPVLRINEIPKIETRYIESDEGIFGVGEASTPTVAPALGNAIFAATGRRIRELPFNRSVRFA